ncbi:MAG: hypothetical protein MHM6MM_002541 [Cercozoa sp. M6MM]
MDNDDVIWGVISKGHCAFRDRIKTQDFCKNKYNVTGLCARRACPLANAKYATVREDQGVLYLMMKTPERAHQPARLWQKVRLKRNYAQALEQISSHLEHWPKFLQHKCKQRLTKLHQYLIRARQLRLKSKVKLVTIQKKHERRDRTRERKALKAAKITTALKKELLTRLHEGSYESVQNHGISLHQEEVEEESESEEEVEFIAAEENEFLSDDDELEELHDKAHFAMLGKRVASDSEDEDDSGDEGDDESEQRRQKKRRRGDRKKGSGSGSGTIEYEFEYEQDAQQRQVASH